VRTTVPSRALTEIMLWASTLWPFWKAVVGRAVTALILGRDTGPAGLQPTHPGPIYQLTIAGYQEPKVVGIQNHPKNGSKFQSP
jgi:hypothetical protein